MTVSLNPDQQVYVLQGTHGVSCYGFRNCFRDATALAHLLGQEAPKPEEQGTLDLYHRYQALLSAYGKRSDLNQKTWFDPETPAQVRDVLETLRQTQTVVRLFFGEPATGKCWLDEWDVIGRIGRSMGPMRVPLLIPPGHHGGSAILTANIVRIISRRGREYYKHPRFNLPELKIQTGENTELPYEVYVEGKCHARFPTQSSRLAWIRFMRGERFDLGRERRDATQNST